MGFPKTALARYTEEEYLALERQSEERHIYLDGEIFLMAGESLPHGDICTNLVAELRTQLKGTPCRVLSKDMKIRSGPLPKRKNSTKGMYSFPDVVVVCGQPQFLDDHQDVIINPKVIIEVLSPSTEAFDCNEKFRRYRSFTPSLTDYLLIAQDNPVVQHFTRQEAKHEDGLWVIAATATELADSVQILSINCRLPLAEIYDRVSFPEEEL